jgi:cyclase
MKEVLGMSNIRIIAKLDVKPPYLVKPVHFEGLRKLGEPVDFVKKYQDADEIFYIDIVASLYEREVLFDEIRKCADETLVPFAVGGGVRSLEDFSKLFHNGADKVVINTHAIKNPSIIDEASKIFGNQAVVVNIEAKKQNDWWECYTDCGRNRSNKDVVDWAREVEQRGAGEILLQSVDCDGRKRGFDLELAKKVIDSVNIPVVVASGAGSLDDIKKLASINPSGIAIASLIHYDELSISDIKKGLR